ncbi:UDP-3-O-acylglucosamine N-acyltransferase [Nitrospira sp.]|nr:UDP-3-O-acylglucosamine N-acyltransferase [Nitrospira sp.]
MATPIRPVSLGEIAAFCGGRLTTGTEVTIAGLSSLEDAAEGDLSFVVNDRHHQAAQRSRAAAFVVARPIPKLSKPQIVAAHPALAFARVAQEFFCRPYRARGIMQPIVQGTGVKLGSDLSVGPFVTLGDRVSIGNRVTLSPGVFIGADVQIGDDCHLHPNVVVADGCRLGSRVVIHSGTVIGSDGFGYVQHEGRHVKVPQLGIVAIEDDVEVGANVTIDRATFGETRIGCGTKIDNLVQIAHNVRIGEHCIIVAQVGIAGSTTVGMHVMIGGQAGLADHLNIGDRVMVAARSGVNRSLTSDQIVSGAPAMPHETALRAQALLPHLPELRHQIRDLQRRLEATEASVKNSGRPRAKRTK